MSYSKREFEKQDSSLAGNLANVRYGVETALRATEEGSLDMFTIDAICISLHDALRHLSAVEDEASGQAGREESFDDETARLDREAGEAEWGERNW
ncbi:MAG: hypothetical protein M3R15_04595 [Acidobacteriota bacterium]|nr:hypothetical protein [Acidobacteriota bacterium]